MAVLGALLMLGVMFVMLLMVSDGNVGMAVLGVILMIAFFAGASLLAAGSLP